MSFLDRFYGVPVSSNTFVGSRPFYNTDHGLGLLGHALETGEYIGASFLTGWVNTKHGDHKWATIRGTQSTYVGGVVLKALAVLADIFGYGGGWASHLGTVATAAIGTHWAVKGVEAGGGQKQLASASPAPKLPAAKTTTTGVGYIPPAPEPNKWLDLNKVSRVAAMHGG